MPRGKVQIRRIENTVHRQVCFCKRRAGLLKKAKELSVLCDTQVGVIIFSGNGKCFDLCTNGTMLEMVGRYQKSCRGFKEGNAEVGNPQDEEFENMMLKQEMDLLQKGLRYAFGYGIYQVTVNELVALERHLETWLCHIHSAKMQILFREVELLKNKEGVLEAANGILQEKILEDNVLQMLDQNWLFESDRLIPEFPIPLTTSNVHF